MKLKKSFLIICIIIFLFSISSVVAGDINETIVASDNQNNDLIQTDNQNDELSYENNNEENNTNPTDGNELNTLSGTFTDLANDIANADDEFNLTKNYIYSTEDSNYTEGIKINKKITINGNGFTISGNKTRALYVNYDDVILNNITFINCNTLKYCAAIYWSGNNGVLSNCSFVNCFSYNFAGAVYWTGTNGVLSNCSFVNCSSKSSSGAVSWIGDNGVLSNCSFVNCSSTKYISKDFTEGGAVSWSGSYGVLSNCSFVNCYINTSLHIYAGAVSWSGSYGVLSNCSFVNCFISTSTDNEYINHYGGAIYWEGTNGVLSNCSFVNCSNTNYGNGSSRYYGGAIYWEGNNGILSNCSFVNCFISTFINNYFDQNGGAIYWEGNNGILSNCSFVNCFISTSTDNEYINHYGGAIYWKGTNGVLSNCSFVNCSANTIYWYGPNGIMINSFFVKYKSGYTVTWMGDNGFLCNCSILNYFLSSNIQWRGSNGVLSNCNFVNCSNAVEWNGNYGSLSNCSFVNCSSKGSGIVYWKGNNGVLVNCSFMNCSAYTDYYFGPKACAVFWKGNNGILGNCSFVNCFISSSGYGLDKPYRSTVYWSGINAYLVDCSFINCSCFCSYPKCYGSNVNLNAPNSTIMDCGFINCYSDTDGGAIYLNGSNSNIEGCGFVNCYSNKNGGAINLNDDNISLDSCSFINCTSSDSGGAVYWTGNKGHIVNCEFRNCYSPNECIFWDGSNNCLEGCGFVNCSYSKYTVYLIGPNFSKRDCGEIIKIWASLINHEKIKFSDKELLHGDSYRILKKPDLELSAFDFNDNTIFLTPSINKETTGNIKLYINDVYKEILLDRTKYSLSNLNAGNYSIKLVYDGDKNYISYERVYGIEVYRTPVITSSIKNINYGENTTVNVNLYRTVIKQVDLILDLITDPINLSENVSSDIKGIIRVTVDDKSYECDIKDSKACVIIPGLSAGSKIAKIRYYGGNYMANSISRAFNVNKINSNITVNASSVNYGNNVTITVIGPYDATGSVNVNVNNHDYNVDIIDSKAIVNLVGLEANTYPVTVDYGGDSNYNKSFVSTTFIVKKINPIINMNVEDIGFGETVINVVVPSDATGEVTIAIGNQTGNANISNGIARISFVGLEIGNFTAFISYLGDTNYNKKNESTLITGNKIYSLIKFETPEIKEGETTTFNFIAPYDASGVVRLVVANENYSFPVVNGVAKIQMPKLTNGNYKYTIMYSGDSKYSSFTKTDNLTVNKVTPAYNKPQSATKTTLTLKKVTVKKSAKKIVLQATLKQGNNPLKSKKIIFKFNGKKYTAKTNKKGVAKVTIKKKVLKRLKVGKKVKYQASYGEITVKKSVKIKK